MLLERPRSGYDMRRFMALSTDHFWHESDASIYPMLKLLQKEKKIMPHREYRGKRGRTIFEVTPAGKQELLDWLMIPAAPEKRRSEQLLKLFFGAHVSREDMLMHLRHQLEDVKASLARYDHIEYQALGGVPADYPHRPFWLLTLAYGKKIDQAEKRWLEESIRILEE